MKDTPKIAHGGMRDFLQGNTIASFLLDGCHWLVRDHARNDQIEEAALRDHLAIEDVIVKKKRRIGQRN